MRISDWSSDVCSSDLPEELIEAQTYLKPENFYVTNPNIGRSVSESYIEGKLRKAAGGELDDDGDTGSIQIVLAKYLNVEIGLRLRREDRNTTRLNSSH